MNVLSVLHLISAVAYLYLAGFITLKNPKSPFNRISALLFICMGIWSFSCIFMHSPLIPRASVEFFDRVGSVGSFMISSVFLIFVLIFTEQKKFLKHPYAYGLLFLIPVILLVKKFEGTMVSDYIQGSFGWSRLVNSTPEVYALFVYYILTCAAALFLLIRYSHKQHDVFKKRQATIIWTTFAVAFVLGSITDALLPALQISVLPEMANIFSLVWSCGIAYTIIRYRLLQVTPEMAADEIISTMSESLILLDTAGTIVTVNRAATHLLGFEENDLIGRPVAKICAEKGLIEKVLEEVQTQKNIRNRECSFNTRDGRLVPTLISASGLTQKNHLQGAVLVVYDITDRKQAEDELKKSLREKEILLSEMHHRVKNNLMIISSLLELQSSHSKSRHARQILKDSQSRIKSMQLIHQRMYQSQTMTNIDSTDYIQNLVKELFDSYCIDRARIRLETSIDELPMGFDMAIPCGIIINELISNALKHAFPDGRDGTIRIEFKHAHDQIILSMYDSGIGIITPVDFDTTKSLGLTLISMMTHQLGGTVGVTVSNGTCFTITFPFNSEEKSTNE
ncbi:MAG: PAS domain S-box protein [candidate division WOR-3 bacterium]|nr:MAG: PAS domain S-box protein [candidate division WOR-3 bacterium]